MKAAVSISLRELRVDEFPTIVTLLNLLDTSIPDNVLESRLKDMTANHYRCLAAFDQDRLIGCSGFWILHKYYIGKHIEPDNVIIHPDYQNQGLGHRMMDWLEDYAKKAGCKAMELNCYINNPEALRFWKARGYWILGNHMRKDLGS